MSDNPIKSLLLVEDNPGDARLLWEIFRDNDTSALKFTVASSLGEAEQHLARGGFDLILLDLGLPDGQGLEVVRRVRAAAPTVPIVVLSGMEDERLATQALNEGAQDYLLKGQLETRSLLRVLRYAVERKLSEERSREAMEKLHASEQMAVRAAEAMSAFLATMSHEIRTPLNGVLGMSQAMARDELSDVQRERLTIIQTAGGSLLALLNDLLDASRIQAGKIELEDGLISGRELADGASAFKALVDEARVRFTVTLAPGSDCSWVGDAKRVRQVLHNLVSNAVKFTERGSVEVELFDIGAGLVIRVRDTGIGIPKDRVGEVFEKFVQADATVTRRYGGSGLGLTICRDLVTLMKGHIDVESEEGVGTVVTASLPLARVDPAMSAADEPPAAILADPSLDGLRVLAAEDNLMNQLVLTTLLEGVGIHPLVVANGEEAVRAWRGQPWDIVLMDIQMPVMDGATAARQIREIERREGRARTPIIALTANAMAHHESEYLSVGMDALVAKPISLAMLLKTIDAVIGPTEIEMAG